MAYMQMAMTDFRVKAFIGKLELGLQEYISQNNLSYSRFPSADVFTRTQVPNG